MYDQPPRRPPPPRRKIGLLEWLALHDRPINHLPNQRNFRPTSGGPHDYSPGYKDRNRRIRLGRRYYS